MDPTSDQPQPPPTDRRSILTAIMAGLATVATGGLWWIGRRADAPTAVSSTPISTAPGSTLITSSSTTSSTVSATEEPTASRSAAVETTTATNTVEVAIICREAWDAAPAGHGMVAHTVDRLTLHHTATPLTDNARARSQIRSHQKFHQGDRGWPDIAYHVLVDLEGNLYQGRDPAFRGDTATRYDPTGHFLVSVDGNYDNAEPNDAQITALVEVLAWAAQHYGVAPSTLGGHRDYASTSCPGDRLNALLDDGSLVTAIEARLADSTFELVETCPEL